MSVINNFRTDITMSLLKALYCNQHLSSYEISKKHSCDAATIRNHLRKFGLPVRTIKQACRYRIFRKFPGQIKYPKRDFDGDDARKAYLIGFRLGDLTVVPSSKGPYSQTVEVRGRTTQPAQRSLFIKLFQGYGHLNESRPDQNGGINLIYYLNRSFAFLIPKRDSVEDWIRNDPRCAAAFAAGYIDAEGSFYVSTMKTGLRVTHFGIASQDKNILHWLYHWLLSNNITCQAPTLAIPHSTIRPWALHRDHWILQNNRKDSLLQMIHTLTPWIQHPKRQRDMIRVVQNIIERNKHPRLKFASRTHRNWVSQLTLPT